jgi:hypothetical protein
MTESARGTRSAKIPTVDTTTIAAVWPGDRFDVIWAFALDVATGRYVFGQAPQLRFR